RHWNLLRMHAKNLFTAADVRTIDDYATIETARSQKRWIQNVWTVRGGDQDHAVVRFEAIHLHQQLIQRLLALIGSAAKTCAAVASNRVNLIDKDDARSILLALLEQIASSAGAHADKHLHKVRARDGEERYIR